MECPKCKAANPYGNKYCGNCAAVLRPEGILLDPDLRQYIQSALREELRDQKVVEIEVTEAIVTRLITWTKLLGYFVGIPLAVVIFALGFLGYKSYSDFSRLVNDAGNKIRPTLEQARADAEEIKRQSEDLKKVYAQLDSDAATYRQLNRQVGVLTAKVDQIAEKIDFRTSTNLSEQLKQKLTSSLLSYQEYMKKLGFLARTGSVGVSIRRRQEMTGGGVSYYDPKQNAIVVESSYANDTDLVLLEYTRRALFLSVGERSSVFSVPANEAIFYGLASYFPCSFKNSSIFGDVSAGAHQEYKAWDLSNDRKFAELQPSSHHSAEVDGREIWGGAFWEVRHLLGREPADKLLFSAWTSVQPSFDLRTNPSSMFAKKIIEMVRSIEGGQRVNEVQAVFARRGMSVLP